MGFWKLDQAIATVKAALTQTVRVGIVSSVNEKNGTVRVEFGDADAKGQPLVSDELAVLFHKTLLDKFYCMPDVGEHVLCLFLPFGLRQGFVLGAIYSQADGVPKADKDVLHVRMKDGSWFEYHRGEHKLSGHVVNGYADLTVDIDAELKVGRDLTARIERDADITIGHDAQLTVVNDLTATVGNDAAVNVTENLSATATNISAEADETAEVTAGTSIDLSAPKINFKGFVSQTDENGEIGHETKRVHTEHEGSYTLTGTAHIDELTVDNLTVTNPINGTIAGS